MYGEFPLGPGELARLLVAIADEERRTRVINTEAPWKRWSMMPRFMEGAEGKSRALVSLIQVP